MPDPLIDIEITLIRTTKSAHLVEHAGARFWLPKSQVEDGHDLSDGMTGLIRVTKWIAEQKGIE